MKKEKTEKKRYQKPKLVKHEKLTNIIADYVSGGAS